MKKYITIIVVSAAGLISSCTQSVPVQTTKPTAPKTVIVQAEKANANATTAKPIVKVAENKTVKPYTSKICLVSEEELGSMGKPVVEIYQNQEIKFCCKACVKKFHANPEKYLANLPKQ